MDNNEEFKIKFGWQEILLTIAIVIIIIGVVFCSWTAGPGEALIAIGVWIICGYITNKILNNTKGSFALGLVLGVIGVVIAVVMKISRNNNTSGNNNSNRTNKYEDLEKLQKLKDSGAITEIEFEIEKRKLLS